MRGFRGKLIEGAPRKRAKPPYPVFFKFDKFYSIRV